MISGKTMTCKTVIFQHVTRGLPSEQQFNLSELKSTNGLLFPPQHSRVELPLPVLGQFPGSLLSQFP